MAQLVLDDIRNAQQRINGKIKNTPIVTSSLLNQWLGHDIYFKAECLQTIGAFKARGALNALTWLNELGELPETVVANSSGNHAQAVAFAAKELGIKAKIFSPANVSSVKAAATRYYGAELDLSATRAEADKKVQKAAEQDNTYWLPPFNHPQIICGQGTAAAEALDELSDIDLVAAPCGGGGLLSGSLVATRGLSNAEIIGVEPLAGNDAAMSLQKGSIQRLEQSPNTLADGAATLAVGNYTFPYLQQLDGFYTTPEANIAYWTQWLSHLLKLRIEPTSAMTMHGVQQWLQQQQGRKSVLVILSGGNIDQQKELAVWNNNYLELLPTLDLPLI